jgi:hypothetical protein
MNAPGSRALVFYGLLSLFFFVGTLNSCLPSRIEKPASTPKPPPPPPPPLGDSSKGQWGRLIPIADNNHPNLYYNQSEIDELRNMILVLHSPAHLFDLYTDQIKEVLAVTTIPDNHDPHETNMKAALSYAIEPTSTKADAIRRSLLSFMNAFPNGLPDWYETRGCFFCGYSVPWMFDLIMAYHPDKLSQAEKTNLKNWFAKSAQRLKFNTRDPRAVSGSGLDIVLPVTREGKTMVGFPNWYSRYMGPSLACALVSGNQDDVDYWGDSGWPHNLLTFAGVSGTYPSDSANRYDLVMYLLAVYPSGANTDTYDREGYRLSESDWNTVSYTDGGYHWAQMSGAILGAEMAYHNGMTGVFGITDVPGTEPALLRTYKRAIQSRTEVDRRPTSLTGHPIIGYDPVNWAGYRRYSDPLIEGAVAALNNNVRFGNEMPPALWKFFGYPRRIAWTPGTTPPPSPSPLPLQIP